MKSQTTGTLVDNVVQLDEPVDLPNHSRVNVSIERIGDEARDQTSALESFKELIRQHPIHSGGHHYTRDELHERH